MNNLYFKQLVINAHTDGNELIYYLQKFPLTKKLVTDEWYKNRDLKLVLSILNKIRKSILDFIIGMFCVFFVVVLPCLVFESASAVKDNAGLIFHLMFWMFCIFGAFTHNSVASRSSERNDYIMLHVMHTSAKEYYMTVFCKRLLKTFADFFVLVFFGGFKVWLVSCIYVIFFRCMGEAVNLFLYDKKKSGKIFNLIAVLTFSAGFIFGEIMSIVKLGNIRTYEVMTSVPAVIITVLAALVSCVYMVRYRRYRMIAKELVTYDLAGTFEKQKVKQKNLKDNLVMNSSDEKAMQKSGTGKFEDRKGYDYLTAIFFDRHRHLFLHKAMFKLAAVLLAAVVIFLVFIFVPDFGQSGDFMSVMRVSPAMIYWLYLLSSGQLICQSLFYDCDRVLLKYGYYRQGRAVLENFKHRIKYIILIDLIPTALLSIVPFEVVFLAHRTDLLFTACFVCLGFLAASVFFSVFHTMMYYIFQPFTEEMTVHGKAYKVINSIMIIGAYSLYMIPSNLKWDENTLRIFYVIFSVASIMFIPVSLLLVYRFAPKRFNLK